MDPLTFATIVGLLSEFVSHRRADERATLDEFLSWLADRRHDEIANLLRTTAAASIGTKALLNETRDVLLARISSIDRALVKFASTVEGFSALATAFSPAYALSEQAVNILRQIDASGASKILELHSGFEDSITLVYLDGTTRGTVSVSDARFLQDDLKVLTELGLLRPDFNPSGGRFFHYTRAAASLVRAK